MDVQTPVETDQCEVPRRELQGDEAEKRDEPTGEDRRVFEIVLVRVDHVLVEEIQVPRVQRGEIGERHGNEIAHGGVLA